MPVELAESVFRGGPKDSLATADVYNQKGTSVINSIQKLTNSGSIDLAAVLRGGPSLGATLPVIRGLIKGQPILDKENLIRRLAISSPLVQQSLRGMPASLSSRIASSIPLTSVITATVGEMAQQVDIACLEDLPSLGAIINQITGNKGLFKVEDKGAQIGVYTGVIGEASHHCKMGNVFGLIMGSVKDPYILNKVAQQSLPAIINAGDFYSLQAMSSILPAGAAKSVHPKLVAQFTKSFQRTKGTTVQARKGEYSQMTGAFGGLDPNWNRKVRASVSADGTVARETIVSVHNTIDASDDFHELVKMRAKAADAPVEDKLQVLATVFEHTTVDEALRRYFPRTFTGAQTRKMSITRDPRTVAVFA